MSLLRILGRRGGPRFLTTMLAPGATPGDVLTVQEDGSVEPAAPAEGGGSQPQTGLVATVPIASADVLDLSGSPYQLVPAPGAGVMAFPRSIFGSVVGGTTTYNNAGSPPSVQIRWGNPGVILAVPANTLVDALLFGFTAYQVIPYDPADTYNLFGSQSLADLEDWPITLTATPNYTDGDGDLFVTLVYDLIPLTAS